ncbi:zinc finger CCCH domain-containing protein 10-like [Panonychus citri]|uniref:zinc finger CCCH domain-containing protein 10-like n=1 Tax=Panonychus citri TaxID=50023 RepID=UPI0023078509|nr:zinc finger CCCH domain-containing protein 10-like [Panonychus citri]XP_053210083.1 zinc finger CCCH domain-containing protein 10-like [Panonychus citri]
MGPNHNHQDHRHNQQDNCHSNGAGGGKSNHLNSNNSSNGNSSLNSIINYEVCRDFLRNVCRRGANCRYRHPERNEAEELGKKVDLIFCHDYQNKECRRSNCRFIHCTKQEEDIYRATGKLPVYLIEKLSYSRHSASSPSLSSGSFHHQHHPLSHQHHNHQQADFMKSAACDNISNNGIAQNSSIASNSASSFVSSFASSFSSSLPSPSTTLASPFLKSIPVCKDNLKGDCLRGVRCKFRHISAQAEYDLELRSSTFHSNDGIRPLQMDRNHVVPPSSLMDSPSSYQGGLAPPEPKRRAYDSSLGFGPQPPISHPQSLRTSSSLSPNLSSGQPGNHFEFSKPEPPQNLFNNSRFLEDENFNLRRHIEELKKQVADLMASNEFLIEQNAQLRTIGTRSINPLLPPQLNTNSSSLSQSNESFIGSRSSEHGIHHQQQQQQQQHFPIAYAQL